MSFIVEVTMFLSWRTVQLMVFSIELFLLETDRGTSTKKEKEESPFINDSGVETESKWVKQLFDVSVHLARNIHLSSPVISLSSTLCFLGSKSALWVQHHGASAFPCSAGSSQFTEERHRLYSTNFVEDVDLSFLVFGGTCHLTIFDFQPSIVPLLGKHQDDRGCTLSCRCFRDLAAQGLSAIRILLAGDPAVCGSVKKL